MPVQTLAGASECITIARALALEPKLIVCDEAVSVLDVSIQAQVLSLLTGLQSKMGLSYLFIAHDLPLVRDFAHRVIVMKGGRIVEQGPTTQIFDTPRENYTRNLIAASLSPAPEIQAERRKSLRRMQKVTA